MKRTWKVFSLSVAGCLLAISFLPLAKMVAAQKTSNWDATDDQTSAIGSIRSINTAEVYYAKEYKKGWSPTLAALGVPPEGVKPSAAAAGLLQNNLTNGRKANHLFTFTAGEPDANGKINTYTLSVRPLKWHPGRWNFFDDESAIIRGTQENRAAAVSDLALQ